MNEGMKIYNAINAVMSELGAIGKNSYNKQQGFDYRGVDDVMNALNPLLVKHKLFVVPEVIDHIRENRQTAKGGALVYSIIKMRYTLIAEDSSQISAVVIGEGMDSGDKASNKAMSVAYKYAMFQIFSIPTQEMKDAPNPIDPDGESYMDVLPPKKNEPKLICVRCEKAVEPIYKGEKLLRTAQDVADYTKKQMGLCVCWKCFKAWQNEENA